MNIEELNGNLDYISVMNRVKPLELLPNFDAVTLSMVAEYFGVSYSSVYGSYNRGKKIFSQYGAKFATPEDFTAAGYTIDDTRPFTAKFPNSDKALNINRKGAILVPREVVFCVAFMLTNSSVAQEICEEVEKEKSGVSNTDAGTSRAKLLETMQEHNQAEANVVSKDDASIVTNGLRIFENAEFGKVRTLTIDGEPYFVGKDVAEVLGYADVKHAILDHVDKEDRVNSKTQGQNAPEFGQRGSWLINESGLYSLILSSKLPKAKAFKHWVTSDVLPAIRKHGVYALEELLNNPELAIKAFTALKEEREKNKRLSEQNQQLTVTNKALAAKAEKWNAQQVINKLMRRYSGSMHGGNFGFAWAEFYENLLYRYSINLNARKPVVGETGRLNRLREDELPVAVKLAVAMCENHDIKTGDVLEKYSLSV